MEAFVDFCLTLNDLFWSLLNVVVALFYVVLPWCPLLAWIGFWTLAVNWVRAWEAIVRGGWTGVLLLMIAAIMVWGAVDPPESGSHQLLGLTVGNYFGKAIYVTMLTCIALLCGSAQMNGFGSGIVSFSNEDEGGGAH